MRLRLLIAQTAQAVNASQSASCANTNWGLCQKVWINAETLDKKNKPNINKKSEFRQYFFCSMTISCKRQKRFCKAKISAKKDARGGGF
jgi:hypothetical protein